MAYFSPPDALHGKKPASGKPLAIADGSLSGGGDEGCDAEEMSGRKHGKKQRLDEGRGLATIAEEKSGGEEEEPALNIVAPAADEAQRLSPSGRSSAGLADAVIPAERQTCISPEEKAPRSMKTESEGAPPTATATTPASQHARKRVSTVSYQEGGSSSSSARCDNIPPTREAKNEIFYVSHETFNASI